MTNPGFSEGSAPFLGLPCKTVTWKCWADQSHGACVSPEAALCSSSLLLDFIQEDNGFLTFEIAGCVEDGPGSLLCFKTRKFKSKFFIFLVSRH